jgi:hypothetical protein
MIMNSDGGKYEVRSTKHEVRSTKYERSYFRPRTSYFVPRTSYFVAAALSVAAAVGPAAQSTPTAAAIRGFSAAAGAAEAVRERELKAMPDAKTAEADFDVMTAEPHHTGSPYEIKLADYVTDQF